MADGGVRGEGELFVVETAVHGREGAREAERTAGDRRVQVETAVHGREDGEGKHGGFFSSPSGASASNSAA
jgi:hypothetical protein